MSKRNAVNISSLVSKKSKSDQKIAAQNPQSSSGPTSKNPFLSKPIQPEKVLAIFLTQARNAARKYVPKETKFPITTPFCEVEARIGVLRVNQKRVTSSGPKLIQNTVVQAFDCSSLRQMPTMESGITRSHYVHWTQAGLSEPSPLSTALGCVVKNPKDVANIKRDLVENEYIETVFGGYPGERRVSFPGLVLPHEQPTKAGQMEYKEKLVNQDMTLPAAKYDLRVTLSSEKVVDPAVSSVPKGWTTHRIKRRRSYMRKDKNMAWQIDVTEVTTTPANPTPKSNKSVVFEVEMELRPYAMLKLINEDNQAEVNSYCKALAQQLWWILSNINPLAETVDVEEYLHDHPNKRAVQMALATCGALKKYMDGGAVSGTYRSPMATPDQMPSPSLANIKFCGCMPINFSRHNIEEIQQSPDNGYFLSEKTDGVRHFMIFTGDTVVLVDRAMRGKQVKQQEKKEPMDHVLPLIKAGTVLDGEVVMHRGSPKHKARPIFIVFDVLAISPSDVILHLPFEQRLQHLRRATFRTPTASVDMFADAAAVADPANALPLVRKNFVKRTELIDLLANVVEEKGMRSYRNGALHNHLTDGIIFQPNLPYVCGTDMHLLKWKYLDTVTIDVELLPPRVHHAANDDDDELRVGVLGEEQTMVDMTRYVNLPWSERYRLEADRQESGARIAEVGFDPETGEWYYLTMRPDKVAPNHISTVLGTLLELSESLTTEELQYRMSIPAGSRDTYRKDVRNMLKQLLEHQKRKHKNDRK